MPDFQTATQDGYLIEICEDCVYVVAYGRLPDDRSGAESAAHRAAMADAQTGSVDITLGGCPEHDPDDDADQCEGWFSWGRCDGCGDTDGGNRESAVVWFPREVTAPVTGCGVCGEVTGPAGGHSDGHDTCPVTGGRAATTTIGVR